MCLGWGNASVIKKKKKYEGGRRRGFVREIVRTTVVGHENVNVEKGVVVSVGRECWEGASGCRVVRITKPFRVPRRLNYRR